MISSSINNLNLEDGIVESNSFSMIPHETISPRSIAYVVRWQLARRRSGSAKTKAMSEISGTTAKPYKQKGTGNARQGSKRSVQFVGGRTCHGPVPRSFDFSIPKKIVKGALKDVLVSKLKEGRMATFSNNLLAIDTARAKKSLESIGYSNSLVVYGDSNSGFLSKSLRNIKGVKLIHFSAVNVYDIMRHEYLLVDKNVFEKEISKILF